MINGASSVLVVWVCCAGTCLHINLMLAPPTRAKPSKPSTSRAQNKHSYNQQKSRYNRWNLKLLEVVDSSRPFSFLRIIAVCIVNFSYVGGFVACRLSDLAVCLWLFVYPFWPDALRIPD